MGLLDLLAPRAAEKRRFLQGAEDVAGNLLQGQPLPGGQAGPDFPILQGPQADVIDQLLRSGSTKLAGSGLGMAKQQLSAQQAQQQVSQPLGALGKKLSEGDITPLQFGAGVAGVPGQAGTGLGIIKSLIDTRGSTFSNVKVDASGQMKGINNLTKKVEVIPGEKIQSYQQVSGTDPSGNPITELVDVSQLAGPARIQIAQNADANRQRTFNESEKTLGQVEQSLGSYRKLLNKHGTTVIPSAAKAELQTSYTDTLLEMKELFNLGVLNGPDLELMTALIINPTTLEAKALEALGGKDVFNAQIDLVDKKIASARQRSKSLFGPPGARDVKQFSSTIPSLRNQAPNPQLLQQPTTQGILQPQLPPGFIQDQ